MPDTYFAVACVILLGALVFAGLTVNEQWKALVRERAVNAKLGEAALRWREAFERRDEQLKASREQCEAYLGQIANYETICTNPGGGYVENAAKRTQAAL